MAEGPLPSPSLFSLVEQEHNSFVKNPERRCPVPSNAERQSTAAIRAVADENENDMESSSRLYATDAEEQASHVVELGHRPDPPSNSAPNPATFWTRSQTGWSEVEDQLAEWFGLDQSKYQWAVDELLERQLDGDHSASKAVVEGLQMQNIQEQTMQRDSKGSNFVE